MKPTISRRSTAVVCFCFISESGGDGWEASPKRMRRHIIDRGISSGGQRRGEGVVSRGERQERTNHKYLEEVEENEDDERASLAVIGDKHISERGAANKLENTHISMSKRWGAKNSCMAKVEDHMRENAKRAEHFGADPAHHAMHACPPPGVILCS